MVIAFAQPQQATLVAFRGSLIDFVDDPFYTTEQDSVRYIADGLLVVEQGFVREVGSFDRLHSQYSQIPITDYSGKLLTPGLIDLHIHFPQTEMIAAHGEQLLEWLEQYTFPVERKFQDSAYAEQVAEIFITELLRNGTTTAVVLASVHPESVNAVFEAADRHHLRLIAGKVMMDRNAPDFLTDTADSSYYDSKALIERWHGQGRSLYAITPRFAPTSTPAQLHLASKLLNEYPGTYLHTHLSENVNEIAWVRRLFPESQGYLDVYDRAGLVGDRSIFAHCIHLTDAEFQRLSEAKAAIAFCPTSNLFLGSGLFKLTHAKSTECPIQVGLATDVGGGTSFSLLQTANEAYKVVQLQQQTLSPFQALFLATLGGARALGLEDKIGSFAVGNEADFIVLDARSTPLMAFRNPAISPSSLSELADRLFSLLIMGDDRAVKATYSMGKLVYGG
ncbi:MAG: guanine deaminase [Leptolyngbyaceae cyanobacterium SL_7_1]|nr:guanine deaminase [Leptolyngbyaceae cyanobacterium SL_7_1]